MEKFMDRIIAITLDIIGCIMIIWSICEPSLCHHNNHKIFLFR